MSQQGNDDLAKALEGLGATPTRPAAQRPGTPARPAQPTTHPPQPTARPAQPTTRPAQPGSKPVVMHHAAVRSAGGASSTPKPKTARAASPLDTPAAIASATPAKPARAESARARKKDPLFFRRTFIPVLLTLGFILVALCVTRFAWKSIDNPMLGVSSMQSAVVGGAGLLLWAMAAALMSGVARQLREVRPD